MWQFWLIFYFIFGATSYILRRVLAQQLGEHNRLINAIFFICFLLPATILLSILFPHNLDVGPLNLLFLFGGSIIWPLFNIVAFRANKEVDVSIFTIISNASPVFTLVIALPLLHESLNLEQCLGVGLLIASGILAAFAQLKKHNRASTNGILFCILSAAVLGVAVAYERFMLNRIDFGAYLIYGWGSQIIWAALLAGKELKKFPKLLQKSAEIKKILFFWGTTSALKSVAFIMVLKISGSASLISAASNFLSVAVVVAAYFYLKERQHMLHKWIAVTIGIAGLLFIAK